MTKKISIASKRTPNGEQLEVINFDEGVASVYAGPGSGKSFTLVERYVRLLKKGIPPENILSLSFTHTAAANLKKRAEAEVGSISAERTSGSRTLHSLSLLFSQEERNAFDFEIAEFPLAAEPVANKLSGDAARRYEVDSRALRSCVSLWKRNRVSALQAVHDAEAKSDPKQLKMALAYKDYDKRCRAEGLLDFDSLMYQMVEILSKKKEVRARWQYQYVMADEAQDNCATDWELLKLLSEKYGNLLVVGDPGQSVFGFRGADPHMFLNMEEMFPGTKKLFLATNYRSTRELVSFLKEIGPVPELSEKFTTPNDAGVRPEIKGFISPALEAAFVVKCIQEAQNV